jgi:diacylglycerol kinase (ATP)
MKRILLLVNPLLQRTHGRRRAVAQAIQVLRAAGVVVDTLDTGENRAAGAKARRAAQENYDAVVVCGGDGTIFDVLQGLAGLPLPLGVIPFGTGNVIAQNLNIPENAEAAARCLLRARAVPVPLGRIHCCGTDGEQSWFFTMAAGMGMHAALMSEARRSGKDATGKTAYFVAGAKLLFGHPVQPFQVTATTTAGEVMETQVCEALAVRVAALNRWRPGGDLAFPFLRLAVVPGASRKQLAIAAWDGLFGSGGNRERSDHRAAVYRDVVSVRCQAIPGRVYQPALAVQADGEVLGAGCARIEMAGATVHFLSATDH